MKNIKMDCKVKRLKNNYIRCAKWSEERKQFSTKNKGILEIHKNCQVLNVYLNGQIKMEKNYILGKIKHKNGGK